MRVMRAESTFRMVWAGLLPALVLLGALAAAGPVLAGQPAAAGDAKCLKCHSKNLSKKLGDGTRLPLHVDAAAFAGSVHAATGCTGCHGEVARVKHPSKRPIDNARDYALAQNEGCRTCHADRFEDYERSVHAQLAAAGDTRAPLCSDCHSAHAIQPMAVYDPVSGQPCRNCHEAIYEAYAQSVHGQARANGNVIRAAHVQAPICADCHSAHDITAVAANGYLKSTCLGCHDEAATAHEQWLPNAGMHLSAVACVACHSPEAERRVDLQLYDRLDVLPVGGGELDPETQRHLADIDAGGDGLNAMELWQLVRQSGREGAAADVTLRGRMEVATGVEAHRIAPRASAVRNCESCHRDGAEPFGKVTVSISRPDGRKQRFAADSDVLDSAVSVGSVRNFYAPGGTRIHLLDGLLVLALVGGLAIPAGHMTLGHLLRKREEEEGK